MIFSTFISISVFLTSILSGIFGMAGGLILMGIFAAALPVMTALALHGLIQFVSNAWRVILHRKYVNWLILRVFSVGAVIAIFTLSIVSFEPSHTFVFLTLGLMPILVWLPERWFKLDASQPKHALAAGFVSTAFSLASGVSGPITDLFFIRTSLTRHQIVATKAAMQSLGHLAKVAVYGAVLSSYEARKTVPFMLLAATLIASMAGIMVGGYLLNRISDDNFRIWRRWIVTLIGAGFLIHATQLALIP